MAATSKGRSATSRSAPPKVPNARLAAYEAKRSFAVTAEPKAKAAKSVTPPKIPGAIRKPLPYFVEPSLAKLVARAPTGPQWVHEIKFDGYRAEARVDRGEVAIITRSGLDWTYKFPPVADAVSQLKVRSALLDGEIVVENERGIPSFSLLQQDLKSGRTDRMVYYAFDLLYLDGQDLRSAKLLDRKAALSLLVGGMPASAPIRYSEHVDEDGELLARHACKLGLEGIVSKRADLGYQSGRGTHWLKRKCTQRQELVVVGYLRSSTGANLVGALVLGLYENDQLIPVGKVGTGFTAAVARSLWKKLSPMEIPVPPLDRKRAAAYRGAKWVRPELVAEIDFAEWTHDGTVRHASFKGLREDKDPREVVREVASPDAAT